MNNKIMKTDSKINYFFILTFIAGVIVGDLIFSSCTKIPDAAITTNEVKISIDYVFPHSGNITAKDGSTYLNFYNKYISSKVLTPRTYSITLTGLNLHTVTGIDGKWGSKILFALPPDRYVISGYSSPTKYDVCGDTCYLKFNDTIDVTQTTTNINLKAEYDCSLILIDSTDVKSVYIISSDPTTGWGEWGGSFQSAVKTPLMKTEDFYHTFFNEHPANGDGCDKVKLTIDIWSRQIETLIHVDPGMPPQYKETGIVLWLYPIWEAGKYYYFGNADNNYTLSQFTNGN